MSRPRVSRGWIYSGLIAAAAVAFLIFRDELPSLDLENLIEDLSRGLGSWTYLLVAVLAFLETGAFVGLVAPGEFTVMLGGAVAGQGDILLPLIIAITWVAAFSGDSVSFALGSRLGRGFLVRHGERVRITEERLKQVEDYFDRHGGKTIVIGRFIGLVRALAPFIAGTSGMGYRAFAPYSILGTGLWAVTFVLIGYFASQSLDEVSSIVGQGLITFGIVVGGIVVAVLVYRQLRSEEGRRRVAREIERRPYLRPLLPLARRLRPQARFIGRRLRPGALGLELTTLLAALSVALFVLISYWSIVGGDPGPTPGDETALEVSDDIRSSALDSVAKAVTTLGAGYVVFPLAALAAVALARRRHWTEAGVLVAGAIVIAFGVDLVKDWTDRPRPADPLAGSRGASFPSGHAANATVYVFIAVVLGLRVLPRLTYRSLVVAAAIALAAVVGLTRAYLRVHWLSDVSAGWALGVTAFAAAAIVALIGRHIRDNLARDDASEHSRGAPAGARH
ncbi:MAG: bifunctional DedA family/phosphatase PAP2 family protein [Solirubrobacterales bacterium]